MLPIATTLLVYTMYIPSMCRLDNFRERQIKAGPTVVPIISEIKEDKNT
jgi:hypothetical protein